MWDAQPTVFVLDPDPAVRSSLEEAIRAQGWTPRLFASGAEFLACPAAAGPSCLVLDVSLPDLNGLEVQAHVARERAQVPIIFITGYGDVATSVRAMKAGAIEFLTKPFSQDVLLQVIEAALERSRATIQESRAVADLGCRYASLTPRETEVMELVVAGLLNKQVAGSLGISEITVKAHRGRVMEKMKAHSLCDLVRMTARLGLAPRPGLGRRSA
jgi:FixJ family two-component response regulator